MAAATNTPTKAAAEIPCVAQLAELLPGAGDGGGDTSLLFDIVLLVCVMLLAASTYVCRYSSWIGAKLATDGLGGSVPAFCSRSDTSGTPLGGTSVCSSSSSSGSSSSSSSGTGDYIHFCTACWLAFPVGSTLLIAAHIPLTRQMAKLLSSCEAFHESSVELPHRVNNVNQALPSLDVGLFHHHWVFRPGVHQQLATAAQQAGGAAGG
jgi:hypothetical protein